MNNRPNIGLMLLALLVLLLGACQPATEPTPEPAQMAEVAQQVEQQSVLLDTAWTVQSFGGADDPIPVVPDTFPTVNFLGTRYAGFAGCNYYLGVYGIDGNVLGMNTPAVTRGMCENYLLAQQEDLFLTGLIATSSYEIIDGNLVLYVLEDQAMTLEPLEPVPFEGTTWNFEFQHTDQLVWLPVIPGTSITAQFEGDKIMGSAGCNDYDGTVVRDGNQMTISELAVSSEMCAEPEGIMEQEQLYLERLATTGSIREYARSFELFDTEKAPLMIFGAD